MEKTIKATYEHVLFVFNSYKCTISLKHAYHLNIDYEVRNSCKAYWASSACIILKEFIFIEIKLEKPFKKVKK